MRLKLEKNMKFTIVVQENGQFDFLVNDKPVLEKEMPEEIAPLVAATEELKVALQDANIPVPVLVNDIIKVAAEYDASEEQTAYIVEAVTTLNSELETKPAILDVLDQVVFEADELDDEYGPLHVEESASKAEAALLDSYYHSSDDPLLAIEELEKEVAFAFEEAKEAIEEGHDLDAYDKLATFFPSPSVEELTNYIAEVAEAAVVEAKEEGQTSANTANQLIDAFGELRAAVIDDPYESVASLKALEQEVFDVDAYRDAGSKLLKVVAEYKDDYAVDKLAKLLAVARDRPLDAAEKKTLAELLVKVVDECEALL
jgi:hypothetical protein